jgi:antitoxin PrlF
MKAVVSQKGQVTIPKRLRDRLGIQPGAVLDFQEESGRLVAGKTRAQDPIDAVYGIIALGQSTDSFITDLRGEADAG